MKYGYLSQLITFIRISLAGMLIFLSGCGDRNSKGALVFPEVGVVTLKSELLAITKELPGRTRPYRVAEVRPQVSGIILKRQFVEGHDVKAGQSLYQIDPAIYQAAYESAQGELAKAEANAEINRLTVNRYQSLLSTKYISRQDYDKAVANLKQGMASVFAAKAALEKARIDLYYTKVYSPINGRIGKSNVTEGALVTANQSQPMASVQQLNPIYVDLTQSSSDFLQLKRELVQGLMKKSSDSFVVELVFEDGTLYNQKGTLQFSDVTVEESTGSIILRAIFPNPQELLLPGMFVRARIHEGVREHAILAPQQGVTRNARGEATAWIVDANNKVVERVLITDRAVGDKWVILKGLKEGDKLIVAGQLKVRPGMTVKPEEVTQPQTALVKKPHV